MLLLVPLLPGCAPDAVPLDADEPADPSTTSAPTGSADWTVDCNGSGDTETITDAIELASSGDWIQVLPCTYSETVNFGGKTLWISSTAGPEDTILDARHSGYAVTAADGEGDQTALVGFTITGGQGAAVYVDFSALRLEDVVITETSGDYAIYSASGDLEMQSVTVENNTSRSADIVAARGVVVMSDTTVDCGNGGIGLYASHGAAFVDWSTFSCRGGYGHYWTHAVGRIQRTSVEGSTYILHEDDHYDDAVKIENVYHQGSISQEYGAFHLRNSIVDGGTVSLTTVSEYSLVQSSVFLDTTCALYPSADAILSVSYNAFAGGVTPDCSGVYSWVGADGNQSGDPGFVDEAGGDFHLSGGSPLVDAGLPDSGYDDVDGSRNDVGIYGGPRTLDGGW